MNITLLVVCNSQAFKNVKFKSVTGGPERRVNTLTVGNTGTKLKITEIVPHIIAGLYAGMMEICTVIILKAAHNQQAVFNTTRSLIKHLCGKLMLVSHHHGPFGQVKFTVIVEFFSPGDTVVGLTVIVCDSLRIYTCS